MEKCIEDNGTATVTGYPLSFNKKTSTTAARAAYMAKYGPLDSDLWLKHICGNNKCVNPEHMTVIHATEARISGKKPVGEKHHWAKLSDKDVALIKEMIHNKIRQREIALKFNISRGMVSHISTGFRRKHDNI